MSIPAAQPSWSVARAPLGQVLAVDVIELAGVEVAQVDMNGALQLIEGLLGDDVAHTVVTCNVDHMNKLQTELAFRVAYEGASLITADGAPLVWLGRLLGARGMTRVTGADLMPGLCSLAAHRGYRVAIVGGAPGVPEAAAAALVERFPGLQVVFTSSPSRGFGIDTPEDRALIASLLAQRADIVFACLGAPKQELWMEAHRHELPGAVLLGVGAAVDFAAGSSRRAPNALQQLGLEWLVRLALEPKRLWRRYLVDGIPFLARTATTELLRGRGKPRGRRILRTTTVHVSTERELPRAS